MRDGLPYVTHTERERKGSLVNVVLLFLSCHRMGTHLFSWLLCDKKQRWLRLFWRQEPNLMRYRTSERVYTYLGALVANSKLYLMPYIIMPVSDLVPMYSAL